MLKMLKSAAKKFSTFFALLAILVQSFGSPIALTSLAYAQETTPPPTSSASPTPSDSPAQTPDPTAVPTSDVSPTSDVTPTPEPTLEPTPTPTDQPSPTPDNTPEVKSGSIPNDTSGVGSEQSTPPPLVEVSPTAEPTVTPAPVQVDNGQLSVALLHNNSPPQNNLDLSYSSDSSATLTADKSDYAPTDIAIISGSGFKSNHQYTIVVSSQDEPVVAHSENITTDSEGTFTYSYQLDGTYRPNYTVEVKVGNHVVAATTFTDTNSVTICHATNSNSNPYSTQSPNIQNNGSLAGGHLDHTGPIYPLQDWGDIIPPYNNGNFNYPGMNWTTQGQAIKNNNCKIPSDLTITKTNNVNGNILLGQSFTWTLTITNVGNGPAEFNNQDIIQDNLPTGATYAPTSNIPVSTSGGVTGSIDCDINSNMLDCDDNSGGNRVVIPPGESFNVSINVTPSNIGTLTNPRSGGNYKCQVDPDNHITESYENNNTCSNSVTATSFVEGHISGHKFNDLNGNGIWDQGEPAIQGWKIWLDIPVGDDVYSTTDDAGYYNFTNLGSGQYKVYEENQDGWIPAAPEGGQYQIQMVSNGDFNNNDFGNYQNATITVQKDVREADGSDISDTSEFTAQIDGGDDQIIAEGTDAVYPVTPGTYTISEVADDDYDPWGCKLPTGADATDFTVQSGQEITVTCTNKQKTGSVSGEKWNDVNGNSEKDCNYNEETEQRSCESTLAGWHIQLFTDDDGEKGDQVGEDEVTDENGNYNFSDVAPGEYFVCEANQNGWKQTYPDNDSDNGQCHEITVLSAGEVTDQNFGNQSTAPVIHISKSNNTGGANLHPGDSVGYTITVSLDPEGGSASNVRVTDLLPDGFKYRSGSWGAVSNVHGVLSLTEPVYSSPGVWHIGSMDPGEIVTLTYTADISSGQQAGLYKDLAWAQGTAADSSKVLALALDPGLLDTNFVGTQVNIIRDSQSGASINIESTKQGEVLGASISLPSTGAQTKWLMFALLMLIGGAGLTVTGLKLRRQNG